MNNVETTKLKNEKVNWTLYETDKQKIKELYVNEEILEIIPSHLEGYVIVKLQIGSEQSIRVVDVGGFGAQEVHSDEAKKTIMSWYDKHE